MDDNTPRDLAQLVLGRLTALGTVKAMEYFGVSEGTIHAWRTGKTSPSLAAAQKVWDDTLLCQSPELWGKGTEPVTLLMPMYEMIEPLTFTTLVRACKLYGFEKISIIPKWRTLIDEARNDLAEKFLLTKSEWCIFPDADGVFPCGSGAMLRQIGLNIPEPKASRNAIDRIMSHPKEARIVGALYKDRRAGNRAQCEQAFAGAEQNARLLGFFDGKTEGDGLEEQGWVGFGFVRIHRSVFEEMKAEMREGGKLADLAPPPGRENEPYGFFGRNSKWRGEDVAFCRRAGICGIKTYVDTGLLLGHIGQKIY
jgi:hypothetical protein